MGHTSRTCSRQPLVPSTAEVRAIGKAHFKNKKLAQLVARLKYTSPSMRATSYDRRKRSMGRVKMARSFLEMARAAPVDLVRMMQEDGMLCNLQGAKCPNPKCGEGSVKWVGFSGRKVLGRLSAHGRSIAATDIHRGAVCYRCEHCRTQFPVEMGSGLLPAPGHGSLSSVMAVLAFFNCVIGISATHTALQLKVSASAVTPWYATARRIMAADAVRRQETIKFGHLGTKTVYVEADESSFVHWSELVQIDAEDVRTHS